MSGEPSTPQLLNLSDRFHAHGLLTLAEHGSLASAGLDFLHCADGRWWWLESYVNGVAALVIERGWVTSDRLISAFVDGEYRTVVSLVLTDSGRATLLDLEPEGGWL